MDKYFMLFSVVTLVFASHVSANPFSIACWESHVGLHQTGLDVCSTDTHTDGHKSGFWVAILKHAMTFQRAAWRAVDITFNLVTGESILSTVLSVAATPPPTPPPGATKRGKPKRGKMTVPLRPTGSDRPATLTCFPGSSSPFPCHSPEPAVNL